MSIQNNENKIVPIPGILEITPTDTISQFMEKCNNNFSTISKNGGGQTGSQGIQGSQGVPTKPKVPIHVWKEGEQYDYEEGFELVLKNDGENGELTKTQYQKGHLILLENAHVYILTDVDENGTHFLKPEYIFTLQSFDPGSVIDGKTAYVHFDFKDGNELGLNDNDSSELETELDIIDNVFDKEYIGIYSSNSENKPEDISKYTWNRIKEKKDKYNLIIGDNEKSGELNVFGNINVNSIVDDEKSGVLNVSGNINVDKFLTVKEDITSNTITTSFIFVGFDDGDSDSDENNEVITYEDGDIVSTNKIYAKTLTATNDISTKTLTATGISATDISATGISSKKLSASDISANGEITTNKIKVGGISVGKNNNKYTINDDGEIIVDKIIANSEVNNQVVINGNDIRIISNDGTNTALFTSDDIQLFTDMIDDDDDVTEESNIISNKYSWNTLYTGVDLSSNNEQQEPQNIVSYYSEFINLNGVFGDPVNLNLNFKIIASMSDSEGIISDWNFNKTNSLTLYIEQYNVVKNEWEEKYYMAVDQGFEWYTCNEFGEEIDGDSENENGYFLSIADANINYEIISDKDPVYDSYYEYRGSKIYRVKTILDTSTIDISNIEEKYDLSNLNILLKIVCDTSIKSHLDGMDPNTQKNGVVIGKNGIIVRTFDDDGTEYGTNGTFYVSKNEILMRVGNFALKICKDGIFKTQEYESCYNIYPTDDETETWKSLFE